MKTEKRDSKGRGGKAGKRARGQRGFTIIETTLALLILMVVGLGAASMFVFSMQNNTSSSERAMAVALAQRRMEWLRSLPWDDPASTNDFVALPTNQWIMQTMRMDNRDFSVQTRIDVDPTTQVRTIRVRVVGGRGQLWARGAVTFTSQRGAR